MNTDIRIAVGVTSHPKTIKLMRRCGDRAFYCLVTLWTWAAMNHPDGDLEGLDDEAVEIASGWTGECGLFAKHLSEVGFIDGTSGSYTLHDWCDHNPWACGAEDRSASGRLNKLASRFPEEVKKLKESGVKGLSRAEYEGYIDQWLIKRPLSQPQATPESTSSKPTTPTPTPNVKDSRGVKGGVKSKPFRPPTVEEVAAYCRERSNGIDPEHWHSHYTSNGWKVGASPMKDWKSAVITWEKRNKASPKHSSPRPMSVKDALTLQSDQIARELNELDKQQRIDPERCEAGRVFLEHQIPRGGVHQ